MVVSAARVEKDFICMNDFFVLIQKNHPLFEKVCSSGQPFFTSPENIPSQNGLVFDLTLCSLEKKENILKHLEGHTIISDLGSYWGDDLMRRYPSIKAAMAASFPSPTNKIEVFSPNDMLPFVELFLKKLSLSPFPITQAGVGFHYPRILSLIINEAWLAKEENIADTPAIDNAMKYGVRYPLGPFEWTKKTGALPVTILLNELQRATGDSRYKPASGLIQEAQKEIL